MTAPEYPFLDQPDPAVYVRHRPRMVRQSIFEDLRDTLIWNQWMVGTTRPLGERKVVVTTTEAETLGLLEGSPINLIDYFPEDANDPVATPLNTFAMDIGRPGELQEYELGGRLSQPYAFNFAFYATSDAVAIAVMSDLSDRYLGVSDSPYISLYNYLSDPPTLVVRMEVEQFQYAKDTDNVAPTGVNLYFAQLEVTDFVAQGTRVIL